MVRRRISDRLQAKFDSADVVQSVWVHVLRRLQGQALRLTNTSHLEAILVTEARHRLTDRLRHYHVALEREQSFNEGNRGPKACPSQQPAPGDIVQADQLWERMLTLCPPTHRQVLQLKRDGHSLTEIAARTGFHEGSVRRILRQLARNLAAQEPSLNLSAPRS
jgi:RNA polymerase sigma-70 factor (ECF subfamily)